MGEKRRQANGRALVTHWQEAKIVPLICRKAGRAVSPRKEYFDRWLLFPLRIDPETKMPRFDDDDGKTPLTDFFAGQARDQYDAIWQYLQTLKKQPRLRPYCRGSVHIFRVSCCWSTT